MTEQALSKNFEYKRRQVDKVHLKGKLQTTEIFELIEWESQLNNITIEEYLEKFNHAFKLYEEGNFKQAIQAFKHCLDIFPDDKTAALLLSRSELFMNSKPADWDGVFTLTSK